MTLFHSLTNVKMGREKSGESKEVIARLTSFLHSDKKGMIVVTSGITSENAKAIKELKDVIIFNSDAKRLRKYEYTKALKALKINAKVFTFDAINTEELESVNHQYFAGIAIEKI